MAGGVNTYNKRRAAVSLPNLFILPVADSEIGRYDRRQAGSIYPIGVLTPTECTWLVTQRDELMNEMDALTTEMATVKRWMKTVYTLTLANKP